MGSVENRIGKGEGEEEAMTRDPRTGPSTVAINRAYCRGIGGRTPLMLIPDHEIYRQPFGAFTTAELLAAVKYTLRFAPCKRLWWEVIRRDLWELALSYPLRIRHCEYFLEVVTSAPYHNQTELNQQCERIIAAGVADFLAVHIAEAKELAGRTISIFERDPGIRVPVTIWVFPKKRSAKAEK